MELPEIIAALDAHIGDDKAKAKEVRDALRASPSGARLVAQSLIDVGAGQKSGETSGKVRQLETERDEAKQALADLTEQFTEFKTKTPDATAIETRLNASWQKKIEKEKERADSAEQQRRQMSRQLARDIVQAELVKPNDAGVYVEPDYAELVLGRYEDRFVDKDDGSLGVLQVGDSAEYDGATLKDKASALARDIRKSIQPRYQITSADSGGGIRSGGTTGGRSPAQVEKQLEGELRTQFKKAF